MILVGAQCTVPYITVGAVREPPTLPPFVEGLLGDYMDR